MKKPKLRTAYVLAFVALTALICPTLSQARVIDVNLTLDLNNTPPGPGGRDFPMAWGTGRIFFPEVNPVAGDTLRIRVDFVDPSTSQPQRVKVTELGIGEPINRTFGRADGEPSLSLEALTNNSFTFHNVIGDILSNPVSSLTNTSGSGIGASVFQKLTDTMFSFTGLTWQVDFLQLRYLSGDGFDSTSLAVFGDQLEVILSVPVPLDIKPQGCPNLLNVKSRGVLPVAILGTPDLDVTTIDPASIRLEGVAPIRSAYEDVGTPFNPFIGKEDAFDCNELGSDGFTDLTLKFRTQEIVEALGDVQDGDALILALTGELVDGTPIEGEDVVIILKKGR